MRLLTLGLNHATAPLAVRERVAIPSEQLAATLAALNERFESSLPHAVVLSTCNRTEVYAATDRPADALPALRDDLARWLAARHDTPHALLEPHWYWHVDDAALRHAFRVASGLDSMVLGETQIVGQMKDAARASEAGALGTPLQQLFQRTFAVAKEVRRAPRSARSVSMAAAAVRLAERIFDKVSTPARAVHRRGRNDRVVATHFAAQKPRELVVANRTPERGKRLADRASTPRGDSVVGTAARMHEFDIIVSCTASTLPIIGLGAVERAVNSARRQPIFMVDLAVPRDIEPEVGQLDDVFLYTVDDLGAIVAKACIAAGRGRAGRSDHRTRGRRTSCTGSTRAASCR